MRPIGPKPQPAIPKEDGEPKLQEKKTCLQTVNSFLDLTLFTHRGFLLYLLGNVIMFFGLFAPLVFLSNYAKSKDISKDKAAFLLSILAFTDMIARPSMGLLANTRWVRPRIQYFFAASVLYNGICHLMAPFSTDYLGFTLMDLVGTQRFSSAVGLVTIVECGPVLLGPPLLGRLNDIYHDYRYTYQGCGAVLVVASVFLFVGMGINYRLLDKEKREEERRARQEEKDEETNVDNALNEKAKEADGDECYA
ncbi:hypothetical protein PO909_018310 [Leuciscus waleckii]